MEIFYFLPKTTHHFTQNSFSHLEETEFPIKMHQKKRLPSLTNAHVKFHPIFYPIPCLQKWYALSAFQTPQPLNRSHSSIPENTVNFLIRRRQNHIFQHAGCICILNPRHHSRHRRNYDQCPSSITSPEFLIRLLL